MATIKRFEDIEAWQKARMISKKVHSLTHQADFKKDFALVDQIRRSSGSVMDNIAEGYERDGNKEFIYFLSIAKGSAGETRSQLYRALDYGYITKEEFDDLYDELVHISTLIRNFMNYLITTPLKGTKFKR